MELSVKDERQQQVEQEVFEESVIDGIEYLRRNLEAASVALIELSMRLKSQHLRQAIRTEATSLACLVLEAIEVDHSDIVHDTMQRLGLELIDDEQLIDRVRREVSRRVDGLTKLLG